MKFVCKFYGGHMNGYSINSIDARAFATGDSGDYSAIRKAGGTVRRPELDNQPTFNGYLGPMWDGTIEKHGETYGVLRYETQEVYNMLSC